MVWINPIAEITGNPAWNRLPPSPRMFPPGARAGMPAKWRWELLRRHALYVWGWEAARRHRERVGNRSSRPASNERDDWAGWAAAFASHSLGIIGCHGTPCDPATPWGDPAAEAAIGADGMGGAADLKLLRGRDLAAMLTDILPPAELSVVGAALLDAAAGPAERVNARETLLRLPSRNLDEPVVLFPPKMGGGPEPVPAPNPMALVLTDPAAKFEDLLSQLRKFHEYSRDLAAIPDGRFRADKIGEQLAAWDCRECWAEGTYGPDEPLGNNVAAKKLGCAASTLSGRHRQAFEFITGLPHSSEAYRDFHAVPRLLTLPEGERDAFWAAMTGKIVASKAGEKKKRDVLSGAVTETTLTAGGFDDRRVDDEVRDRDGLAAADLIAALQALPVTEITDDDLIAAVTRLNGGRPPAADGPKLRELLTATPPGGAAGPDGGGTG